MRTVLGFARTAVVKAAVVKAAAPTTARRPDAGQEGAARAISATEGATVAAIPAARS